MSRKNINVDINNNDITDAKPKPKRGRPKKIVVNDVVEIKNIEEENITSNPIVASTKESKRRKIDEVKLITEVNLSKLTSQRENDAEEVNDFLLI
jgi:hypothetical protein